MAKYSRNEIGIEFTKEEEKLFELIKNFATNLNPTTTPRLAGGFVRDRIMNRKSHDIDIALDNISGYNFALGLCNYLHADSHIHRILANPSKSKHLETAVISLLGFTIDFVHLRSETYAESRIPSIQVGSPEEDAFRRDITINSLFYNLLTDEIEDFTGNGIKDMRNQIIDSPLDPLITLYDDPLRILRIIRFRSKLQFKIEERVYSAIKNEKIKDAIKNKVSNERIGDEITKLLSYKDAHVGLIEIVCLGLVNYTFKPPIEININQKLATEFYENFIRNLEIVKRSNLKKTIIFEYKFVILYIVLQYFINQKSVVGNKSVYVNVLIIKDSLKLNKNFFNSIKKIEENIDYILNLKIIDSVDIVVEFDVLWLETLLILSAYSNDYKYIKLINDIYNNDYEKACELQPIINGDYLINEGIEITKFKNLLRKCKILQLKYPNHSKAKILEMAIENQ